MRTIAGWALAVALGAVVVALAFVCLMTAAPGFLLVVPFLAFWWAHEGDDLDAELAKLLTEPH